MKGSELFKYDVRVRERMLGKGLIDDKQLTQHLEKLPDLSSVCDTVTTDQPALGRHDPAAARGEGNGVDVSRGASDDEDET